jgi:hypothetical protein
MNSALALVSAAAQRVNNFGITATLEEFERQYFKFAVEPDSGAG